MDRPRPGWWIGALAGLTALLAGCVGHSRTDEDYGRKAAKTVEVAQSSVQTVLFTVDAIDDDQAFGPYLGRVIGQAEADASAALDSFSVVQPPSTTADDVRSEVDELVGDAVDLLAEARIAIRRSDGATVSGLRPQLEESLAALERFVEEAS
ncbi:MAG: hypothetical protein ACJ739_00365 [Acidimicrobiales bacterium]